MISLEAINKAKHITILTSSKSFADASALYTHVLRLHKKVSMVSESQDINRELSFLPWFDKVRLVVPSSADLVIDLNLEIASLYNLFKLNDISINEKMATALYAGLLQRFGGFLNSEVNGTVFADVSELIRQGADYKLCNKSLMNRASLSTLRLKAIMLKKMLLINDSKASLFYVNNDDLKVSGAELSAAYEIIKEGLTLPYVEMAILLDSQNRVLKLITEEV